MSEDDGLKAMGQVIQIDEARIRDHLGEMVRGTRPSDLHRFIHLYAVFGQTPAARAAAFEVVPVCETGG
jgi:hypothetical protein